jgi:hypothetical protein
LFSDDDNLLWVTDGGGDIGSGPTSLDNRPSNIWVKDQLQVGDSTVILTSGGDITAGDGINEMFWNASGGSLLVTSPATFGIDVQGPNAAGGTGIRIQNTSSNAAAFPVLNLHSDTALAQIFVRSSNGPVVNEVVYTSASGPMTVGPGDAQDLRFRTTGMNRWAMSAAGHLIGASDNTYDIGSDDGGTTFLRPSTAYFGTSVRVNGTTTDPATTFYSANDGNNFFRLESASNASSSRPSMAGQRSRGTMASRTNIATGDALFFFGAVGYHTGGGGSLGTHAGIEFLADGTISATSRPGRIEFQTVKDGFQAGVDATPNGLFSRWVIKADGHLITGVEDNAYDIGASGATRPRTIYAGTALNVGTGATSNDTGRIIASDSSWTFNVQPALALVNSEGPRAGLPAVWINTNTSTTAGSRSAIQVRNSAGSSTEFGISVAPSSFVDDGNFGPLIGNLWSNSALTGGLRINAKAGPLSLRTADTERWQVQAAGHLVAGTDNTYDIGASGATRPRTAYLGTSLNVGNGITPSTANGDIVAGDGTRSLTWDASGCSFGLTPASGANTATLTMGDTGAAGSVTIFTDGTTNNRFTLSGTAGGASGTALRFETGASTANSGGEYVIVCGDGGTTNGVGRGGGFQFTGGNAGTGSNREGGGFIITTGDLDGTAPNPGLFQVRVGTAGTHRFTVGDSQATLGGGPSWNPNFGAGNGLRMFFGSLADGRIDLRDDGDLGVIQIDASDAGGQTLLISDTTGISASGTRHRLNGGIGYYRLGYDSGSAAARGDFSAGDSTRELFWDASAGSFVISGVSALAGAGNIRLEGSFDGPLRSRIDNPNAGNSALSQFQAVSDGASATVTATSSTSTSSFGINTAAFHASSGADRMVLCTSTAAPLELWTTDLKRWEVSATGHILAATDNDYDIGASGATRPRRVYVGTEVVVGDTITIGATTIDASGVMAIAGTTATSLALGRSGITTSFLSGSTVDFTGTIVVGLSLGTPRQEELTSENIINADVTLADTLDFTPLNDNPTDGIYESVMVFLNGILKRQGIGLDYTVGVGTNGVEITWLANSGTAVDMDTSDILTVVYSSSD